MKHISLSGLKAIRRIQIKTTRFAEDILAGDYHSAFKGKGMEFEEVREYQPGDDVRSIDWNVTARIGHPYSKIFREERELTVMLVVDVSASCLFGSGNYSKNNLLAEIGGVIAFSAIKNHDKVGLILFSDQVELYLPPKNATVHVLRVIRELLFYEPRHKRTDLLTALNFLGNVQQRPTVCFLLSDFLCDPYPHETAILAKKHDLISIAVTDPFEKDFPLLNLLTVSDLETDKTVLIDSSYSAVQEIFHARMQKNRETHKALMNKIGAGFIEIFTDQPYLPPIRKFFKVRGKRR
jgi:uncharacterized protein (DUF58 family)